MFQENRAKRSPMQIIGIIVIFILAVLIVLTFVIFGIFRDANSAPKIFGSRVYVVTNDRMEGRIPNGSAVFINEGELPVDGSSSVILCNIENELYVIGFVRTEITETGDVRYIVKYDNAADDRTWGISADAIVGVATKYDTFLGWVIRFASSKAGMMTIVIIPCALVIIYELLMLLIPKRTKKEKRRVESVKSVDSTEAPSRETKTSSRTAVPIDLEDITPEREDIQAPVDVAREERYVEKQLRRANDKLNNTVLESATESVGDGEISLDPIKVEPETKRPEAAGLFDEITPRKAAEPEKKPEPVQEKPLGDLSASRIDELIKLLEEEKKRLADK